MSSSLVSIRRKISSKFKNVLIKALHSAPQKCISTTDYLQGCNSSGKWHKIATPQYVFPETAFNLGSISIDFAKNRVSGSSGEGVLEIYNAFQVGSWTLSPEKYLFSNISLHPFYTTQWYKNLRMIPRYAKAVRLSGSCLTIATHGGSHYGHWLVESIAKLELFRLAGFDIKDMDHFLCHKPSPGTPQTLFNCLNIPEEKCIWVDRFSPVFQFDTLFAPSHPEIYERPLPWIPRFMRSRFLPSANLPSRRRLYLSRAGYSRNPINAENVEKIFARHGFEIFNPEADVASHIVFSEAAIVVGHTGSAFTGIVFCKPGTKVLELISDDMIQTKGGNAFTLACSAECDYHYLVCRSTHYREDSTIGATPYDFYVNEAELDQALVDLISGH